MNDPTQLSLVEVAEAIRNGSLSSRDLTEACLDKIQKWQPKLNCFLSLNVEDARKAADATDQALKSGKILGPLHGVPLAHKDLYYNAGKVSTAGSKIRKNFVPDHTSTALTRLERAGALNLGSLNMAEFAMGPTGHNVHWGRCCNPWNRDYITGGSSSGSGASVAAQLVFGSLGSDTGGSIRLPAAMCGVVGIKPTQTRVSRYGTMGLSFSLDCMGPLARTVPDCALLLSTIAGYDPHDPTSSQQPVPDYTAAVDAGVQGLTIGIPKSYYYEELNSEVAILLKESREKLAKAGAKIIEVTLPDQEHLGELANVVWVPEAATLHAEWLRERSNDYSEQVRSRLLQGVVMPATLYLQALQLRSQMLKNVLDSAFEQCDVLLIPVLPDPVSTGEETDVQGAKAMPEVIARITRYTRTWSYLGLPGLVVPIGFTHNGLPAAMQIIGRPFDEATLFQVGGAYQAVTGWAELVPSLN